MTMTEAAARPVLIGEEEIREHLRFETLIPAMRQALMDFSAGRIQQPLRSILPVAEHGGLFAAMPAVCGDVMGLKAVTFFPGNVGMGIPTHLATILLLRAATGEPLAVLDGRLITEMRTAAVSAVAVDLLARRDARVLAILGSGVQAHSHLAALGRVRSFEEVRVWSRTAAHAEQFARQHGARACSAKEAVRGADVVIAATSTHEAVLRGAWLSDAAMVVSIGAIGPAYRELDDEAMRGFVVVESREAAMRESGDVMLSGASVGAELGELLARDGYGAPPGRSVYKSLGIAAEDIVSAKLVWEAISAE